MEVDQEPCFRIVSQKTERKLLGNIFDAGLLMYEVV